MASTTQSGRDGGPTIAIVMSGGGARGAYEAGVLAYLLDELPKKLGRPVRFDIVTGTSVGAIHACWVAATQGEAGAGAELADVWRSFSLDTVFSMGPTDLVRVPWRLAGLGSVASMLPGGDDRAPERLPGLFDTEWLEQLVFDRVPWSRIHRNIDAGRLQALAIAATEIATGRSVVFVESGGEVPDWSNDPFVIARAARIAPQHALASAAIPLLFAAIRIGRTYYCDGGLRLNTPLAPALRLGADRVLVIGLRHPSTPEEEDRIARRREANFSSTTYLAGKALNALLLDRIETDVDRMRLFNEILTTGREAYGEEFLTRINKPIVALRNRPYRVVRDVFLRPSEDLGVLAAESLRQSPRARSVRSWFSQHLARYAARGAIGEADLLSYMFFDHVYTERLLALGRADAQKASRELVALFEDD
ncbi:MAG: patatin-like phospholipase family protein [Candidatus Binatia bacterium]